MALPPILPEYSPPYDLYVERSNLIGLVLAAIGYGKSTLRIDFVSAPNCYKREALKYPYRCSIHHLLPMRPVDHTKPWTQLWWTRCHWQQCSLAHLLHRHHV